MVECKDFYQSFEENNYNIDYGYQHNRYEADPLFFIVIGHDYWQIKYESGSTRNESKLELQTQSTTSVWFGNEYKMALSFIAIDLSNRTVTGLIRVT